MKINDVEYKTIWFDEEKQVVKIIDQTKLPHKFIIKELSSVKDSINAIKTMDRVIRPSRIQHLHIVSNYFCS